MPLAFSQEVIQTFLQNAAGACWPCSPSVSQQGRADSWFPPPRGLPAAPPHSLQLVPVRQCREMSWQEGLRAGEDPAS